MNPEIVIAPPDEPFVLVDGTFGTETAALELSHWPGNRTPSTLRHDLSTGCALRYAALPEDERRRLARGATRIVNTHFDTDGTLALFAVVRPEVALEHADALLAAAAAGDFFHAPDDRALALDAIVSEVTHHPESPLAVELEGLGDVARWNLCTRFVIDALPGLLAGDLQPFEPLWRPFVERFHSDLDQLERAARDEDAARDLAVWSTSENIAPGRHALFGSTRRDRVLVLANDPDGTLCRLVISTLSWFDLVSEARAPRPDLARLARALDELEGSRADDAYAWRAQKATNASPELWFGRAELESFAEHNDALAPSRLPAPTIRREIERALLA